MSSSDVSIKIEGDKMSAYESEDVEMLNAHIEKSGEAGLTETQRKYLLSSDDIQRQMRMDEIDTQAKRLDELKQLLGLIKEINATTHEASDKSDEVAKKIEKITTEYIKGGKEDLLDAKRSAEAIRRKKRICYCGIGLAVVIGITVVVVIFVAMK